MTDTQPADIIEQQIQIENQNQNQNQTQNQKRQQKKNTYAPKRGPIIDLEPLLNTEVSVRLVSGRDVTGTMTGYDQLLNIVIEDATIKSPEAVTASGEEETTTIKKIVIIGRMILSFQPMTGYEIIENPNVQFDFVI